MERMMTDRILQDFKQGNATALKQVLQFYRREISYFTWSILKDRETSDEIVNDVFLKAWDARQQFDTTNGLRSYLYVVARNACLNFLKSPRSRKLDNIDDIQDVLQREDTIEVRMMHGELLNAVYMEVEKLPEKQRLVFQLAFFEGLTTKEIAEQLQISPNAVFLNKSQGLKAIRRIFGTDFSTVYLLFLANSIHDLSPDQHFF